MASAIASRGQDGEGIWSEGSVGFAHRRLAIVDVGETGSQPMLSADKSLAVTFNGEIYNYRELRDALSADGATFRSASDTEVLLHLYRRKKERMVEDLRGMFAFAIWDASRRRLFVARDRIGKKPFFYRIDDKAFAFASELKALVLDEKPSVDWQSVRLFLGLQYVPNPRTGFVGLQSLPPAHCGFVEHGTLRLERYDAFPSDPVFDGSEEDAASRVRALMEDSVRLRMIADVPVGAFLSGGVDSAIVTALMAKRSDKPIRTFTMGFPSMGFDERAEAKAWAEKLGAEHHAFEAKAAHAAELADEMVRLYDAPFADSSCLPTWLLARETRKHVKAAMTGDGGDELFGGYRRYGFFRTALMMRALGRMPLLRSVRLGKIRHLDPRIVRMARTVNALSAGDAAGYAELFTGAYFSEADLRELLQTDFFRKTQGDSAASFIVRNIRAKGVGAALEFDRHSYLPDDLNVKMDRATMAHGLEARAPFLDQELFRFVARLPLSFVMKRGTQKPLLARAFADLVPREMFLRRKRGFQLPIAEWFRGALRPLFLERCLAEGSKLFSVCRKDAVEKYLKENDRGADHGNRLWMLTVLATWLERYG